MPPTAEQEAADLRTRARSSGSKVVQRLVGQPLRSLGVGAAAVILVATAGFGGLEPAAVPAVAGIEPGTAVAAAPFELTLTKILWVDELPGAYLSDEGNRWLAITATLTSTDDASVYDPLLSAVALVGVDGLVRPPVRGTDRVNSSTQLVLADGSQLSPVQPGLTYDLVFLFEQSGAVPPPAEVTVQLVGHTKRASTLDRSTAWFDATVVAQATLPLRAAIDTTAADDGSTT